MNNGFEPKIVVFCCNWCSYAGADLVGTSRTVKPNFRMVRTMCSGRIEPAFLIRAFAQGADGVVIVGCSLGDCHYNAGNYKARRRALLLKNMLPQFGIEPERLRLEWASGTDALKLQSIVDEFVEDIARIGSLKSSEKPALQEIAI